MTRTCKYCKKEVLPYKNGRERNFCNFKCRGAYERENGKLWGNPGAHDDLSYRTKLFHAAINGSIKEKEEARGILKNNYHLLKIFDTKRQEVIIL